MSYELCQKIQNRWPTIKKINIECIINYNLLCNNTIHSGDCYGQSYCEYNKNGCGHENIKCKSCEFVVCGHCYQECPLCQTDPKGEKLYGCEHYISETTHRECPTCGMKICYQCHDKCPICKYYNFD